ncbi:unnamed protein product [Medioppia subpectinata]|uniref:Uncharacterized protein n=1 Tax=Medioppia subpectinata TaxID=1979941 RepID=A0A7R9QE51_9ACAR|nr:unnamed protein product [Medioppia subpectinata]CAG2118448.1 unnamed protein product [Medioppia subpectinata]
MNSFLSLVLCLLVVICMNEGISEAGVVLEDGCSTPRSGLNSNFGQLFAAISRRKRQSHDEESTTESDKGDHKGGHTNNIKVHVDVKNH